MSSKRIELFVPGRLCLMGEHSDWAGKYRDVNHEIEIGHAIVTGIEEGIYAEIEKSDKFIVSFDNKKMDDFVCPMDLKELMKVAEEGGFWSYVAGTAAAVKELYNVSGIKINITKETLPTKKGLSSSASICVLVARAFNQIYNLHLNITGEMDMAYKGELLTPSRCGRLDQACAFGIKPVKMDFNGERVTSTPIKVDSDLYFVFADLGSKKDTIKILSDLNKCYPFASNNKEANVQMALGELNREIINDAIICLENGKNEEYGKLMVKAQEIFDKYVSPACPEELNAPVLHSILKDEYIKTLTYGAKGVGSQGDGTVQFLAKDKKCQEELINYLNNEKNMSAFKLTLPKTTPIKKAIIPLAGNGTRMYPFTKIIKKAFLPIIDENGLPKPAVLSLLEELDNSNIEEICLIIDDGDQEKYEALFESYASELIEKLTPLQVAYESKLQRIGKKIKYIVQKDKLGLGHAVSLCKEFANNEPVLLVLGDQLMLSHNNQSCTNQLIECYSKNSGLTISVMETPLEDVNRYGILHGKVEGNNNYFDVIQMVEKPEQDFAQAELGTLVNGEIKYYSVFGEYILTPSVFAELDNEIKNNIMYKGEYQLTTALDEVRKKDGMVAFIPDGEMLDIGTSQAYAKTFSKLHK